MKDMRRVSQKSRTESWDQVSAGFRVIEFRICLRKIKFHGIYDLHFLDDI